MGDYKISSGFSYMWCICHLMVFQRATTLAHMTDTSSVMLFYCYGRVSLYVPPCTNRGSYCRLGSQSFFVWKLHAFILFRCKWMKWQAYLCSQLLEELAVRSNVTEPHGGCAVCLWICWRRIAEAMCELLEKVWRRWQLSAEYFVSVFVELFYVVKIWTGD
jgi:hypothetical protein